MVRRTIMNGKTFFAFLIGAAIGAVGSWVYLNKKYFGPVDEPEEEQPDLPKITREPMNPEETEIEYQKVAAQYTDDEDEPRKKEPYIISREEFNDGAMEFAVTYSYFEDGILTDEMNEVLDDEDVREAIGEDFVNHFDEDLVYIRNESRHCDYEILREGITYNEPPEEE
jgi:hypothetical protein